MKTQKQVLGKLGEDLATKFLKQKGYRILARNWKCKMGELDIVALKEKGKIFKKPEVIIFVEVKTLTDSEFESQAAQNVHYFKQRNLIKSAQCFLKANKIDPNLAWQIDVISIEYDSWGGQHKIRHLENAVW